jgi:hypothetical protein
MADIRTASLRQQIALTIALGYLRNARDQLATADCPNTLAKVRAAIKSAEGAERHMQHRLSRAGGENNRASTERA